MKGILFLCTGNSLRSQMAEGLARALAPVGVEVGSAGVAPIGYVLPLAIEVMDEIGLDLSAHWSKSLDQIDLARFDVLVTVCGHAEEHCPHLPSISRRFHWPIEDPSRFRGSPKELRERYRATRDELARRVAELFRDA